MRLGKREIDALVCPPGKRDAMFMDDELKGFGVRVNASGSKIFLFQYKLIGRVRRLTLGAYGELTPAAARKLAEVARGDVLAGRDPAGERQSAREQAAAKVEARRKAAELDALTLDGLIERWLAGPLKHASVAHRRDTSGTIRRHFARALTKPAHELDAALIQLRLDEIDRDHPTTARRLRTYGRAMFVWAVNRRLLTVNPFAEVVIDSREASRDRVLQDAELGAIWRAASGMAYPFGPYFRLLILTLQRRAEVLGMRWAELSTDGATWTLPPERSKNGQAHIVHLAPEARAILASMPRWHDPETGAPSPLVFTTTGRTVVSGVQKAMERLRRLSADEAAEGGVQPPSASKKRGLRSTEERRQCLNNAGKKADALPASEWRLHDFRRTGVTMLAKLKVPPHVADLILSHKPRALGAVAMIYQRHQFEAERAEALELWARQVLAVGNVRVGGNVVAIGKKN
ncbi:phage DNA recombinase [Tanticharoenia sakaeratensis NBRC 103193]|uniref:Phage DNA recombinase n=2 Tax=Tanticharoenia TaxID=444052 RepID=A0A0D6MIR5_9PROT|nr:phage DNA recombinase [Tanticharoenia sakaeratensis NBRC 103193]